jgi:hypothetical protein
MDGDQRQLLLSLPVPINVITSFIMFKLDVGRPLSPSIICLENVKGDHLVCHFP